MCVIKLLAYVQALAIIRLYFCTRLGSKICVF